LNSSVSFAEKFVSVRRNGEESQEGRKEWNRGGDQGTLIWGGSALFRYLCRGPEFLVMPLLMGPVCLLSQGRFD